MVTFLLSHPRGEGVERILRKNTMIHSVRTSEGGSMEQYWSALQDKLCRKCIDGDGRGHCRLPFGQTCAVQEFLPQLVETVKSLRSDRYDDYVVALRKNVCAGCAEQSSDGVCLRRNAVECALDRYYGLVLQIIESVKSETAPLPS